MKRAISAFLTLIIFAGFGHHAEAQGKMIQFVDGEEYMVGTTILCDDPEFLNDIMAAGTWDEIKANYLKYAMMPSVYSGPACYWLQGPQRIPMKIVETHLSINGVPDGTGGTRKMYIIEVKYKSRVGIVSGFISALAPSVPPGKPI